MMEDSSTNHALTEVALALAMAFFAIMVLAMVSMNIPAQAVNPPEAAATSVDLPEQRLSLQPAAGSAVTGDNPDAEAPSYVFYFNSHYYNAQLQQITLAALPKVGKVILALPPTLSLDRAMALQQQINRPDLVITQLNRQWLQRLEAL